MQNTIHQLKDRLTRALDKEDNVVDMPGVLEVVSALEKFTVTRECLEETRIGKYINSMRKKTSDKDLAKRAKNLVKKWQPLVIPQASSQPSSSFNGNKLTSKSALPQHVKASVKSASPASRPDTPSSNNSSSPNVSRHGRSTPHNQSNPIRISPAGLHKVSSATAFKPISPALQTPVRISSSVCLSRNSPYETPRSHNGHNDRPSTPSNESSLASSVARKRKRKDDIFSHEIPDKKRGITSAKNNAIHVNSNTVINGLVHSSYLDSTSHVNELPSEGSSEIMTSSSGFAAKRQAKLNVHTERHKMSRIPSFTSVSNASDSTMDSELTPVSVKTPSARTPRVKTTAQLLEELASSGSLNISGSEAVRKIALNQIDKEHDNDSSIVPAAAKPRPRKKPKSLVSLNSDKSLHETKHEMVHKFLESSLPVPPTPDVDLNDHAIASFSSPTNESPKAGVNNNSNNLFSDSRLFDNTSSCKPNSDLLKFVGNGDDSHLGLKNIELDKRRVSPVRIKLGTRRSSSEDDPTTIAESAEIIPNSTQDPWALLPEIDTDDIEWDSLSYKPAEPLEVTTSVIERLHSERWSGVNGTYDAWGDWRNWTNTYSASSYNGDLLHILPYVALEGDLNLSVTDGDLSTNGSNDNNQCDQTLDNS